MPSKEDMERELATSRLLTVLKEIDNVGRTVASGATFGFADEIAAVLDTLVGNGNFQESLQLQRKRDQEINPVTEIGGQMVGAVATAPFTGAVSAASRLVRGAGTLATIGRGAVTGAIEGAASAAGNAEGGLGERASAAMLGAGSGAVAAPIGEIGSRAASALGRRVLSSPQNRAADLVNRRLQEDGISLQRAAARIEARGEGTVLADVAGENVRGLTAAAANIPGPGKQKITGRLNARMSGQSARMRQHLAESIAGDDFVSTVDDIVRRRKEAAGPLYEAAFEAPPIQDEGLQELIANSKVIRAAIKRARENIPDFADLPDTDIRLLDEAYKELGDRANAASRQGKGNRSFRAHELRAQLRERIVENVPVYGTALESFAGA